ncbi:MAG: UDP-N-acetylmuramate dehydrogenase [Bacteroidetes bacterium]|nr:UDP-N-acetylmuramate dehydrogenase [Bacteroidota bacterium]
MNIGENISLRPYNTFGIDVNARYFMDILSVDDIDSVIKAGHPEFSRLLILGFGSNILFTQDFDGLVLRIGIKGIEKVYEDTDHVGIKAYAGEKWDDLVGYCVENGYAGLENLSLIPGSTGAAPVQNIGAYGAEFGNCFKELEAIHTTTGQFRHFSKSDCAFSYRNSVFKSNLKDQYAILSVTFILNKRAEFNTSYGTIEEELKVMGVRKKNLLNVREAICRIRRSKLPDPALIGNAGSFFKNPSVSLEKYSELKKAYPNMVVFQGDENTYKISAGWLIEDCGWKGKRIGDAGVYPRQALVLVNYGHASGQNILDLASTISQSVKNRFGIDLESEVNIF